MDSHAAASDERRGRVAVGLVGAALVGALVGTFVAGAGYTAHYAHATSYLSDDPRACVNCHIMNDQYDAWAKSSHHARATCNDCHVPHDSVVSKYAVKAEHGYRHSKGFTFQDFHEPIQMKQSSYDVVIENCVRCHEAMTHEIRTSITRPSGEPAGGVDCIHCHAGVAHGPTR
ncbi:MAG TPA: cytochrome c nitrite reductase small subunit [Phycisphaerales bacterium]|nr:cytochrome c nitrite reductase small subunit [Phycisphaerales bacterium]